MQQPTIEELSKLLGFLYDGHIEEDPYSAFLAETRRLIDSNFASITMREPQGDDGGLLFVSCEALTQDLCRRSRQPVHRPLLHLESDDQPALGQGGVARRVCAVSNPRAHRALQVLHGTY